MLATDVAWLLHPRSFFSFSCSFCKSKSKTGSSSSSFDFAFPPQLQGTLNRLYHLRRGHLISPGPMQSIDDRAGSRKLFIRFPLEDCLKMIRPSLWSTGSTSISSGWDSMIPFPAETLALWDDVSRETQLVHHFFSTANSQFLCLRHSEHHCRWFPRQFVHLEWRKLHGN